MRKTRWRPDGVHRRGEEEAGVHLEASMALVSGEAGPTRHGGQRRGAQEEQDAWLGGWIDGIGSLCGGCLVRRGSRGEFHGVAARDGRDGTNLLGFRVRLDLD